MDDLKSWFAFYAAAAVIIVTFIISVTVYNTNVTNTIGKMVLNGADPIAVACAVNFSENKAAMCALQVTK